MLNLSLLCGSVLDGLGLGLSGPAVIDGLGVGVDVVGALTDRGDGLHNAVLGTQSGGGGVGIDLLSVLAGEDLQAGRAEQQTGGLRYQPGAVLTNLFLADELNRATSRTQSALLEAMEEGQVTVDGVSHPIPSPFIVIATQNPVGAAGTQLLPDSQMDRFMIRLSLGYPEPTDEVTMVLNRQEGNPLQSLMPIVTREQLIALQDTVEKTFISDTVVSYIVRLVGATRNDAEIARGASPRATLAVAAMSKAVAQLRGRDYVIPGDVREVFARCVEHRLILTPRAQTQGILPGDVLERIVQSVPAPKLR